MRISAFILCTLLLSSAHSCLAASSGNAEIDIKSAEFKVKSSAPLWAQYGYTGKKELERHDIAQAQRFFWAAVLKLQQVAKDHPHSKIHWEGREVVADMIALSNDVFFQDPNPAFIKPLPLTSSRVPANAGSFLQVSSIPSVVLPHADSASVDAVQKDLIARQALFNASHTTFDGGALLRLMHLRQRIAFLQDLAAALQNLLGATDPLTKQANQLLGGDLSEFKDLSTQG